MVITFANGEKHECSFAVTNPVEQSAFFALADVDFAGAARIFSDPEMTSTMETATRRFIGYTSLQMLYVQPYGIQAILKGGHDESIN